VHVCARVPSHSKIWSNLRNSSLTDRPRVSCALQVAGHTLDYKPICAAALDVQKMVTPPMQAPGSCINAYPTPRPTLWVHDNHHFTEQPVFKGLACMIHVCGCTHNTKHHRQRAINTAQIQVWPLRTHCTTEPLGRFLLNTPSLHPQLWEA
jgi:hypothetical protein